MPLKTRILDDVKTAMRNHDRERLAVLRLVTAAIKQREVDERIELDDDDVPAQIVWGKHDSELTVDSKGSDVKLALNLQTEIHQVEGKHFLQENCAAEIADRIALLVKTGEDV